MDLCLYPISPSRQHLPSSFPLDPVYNNPAWHGSLAEGKATALLQGQSNRTYLIYSREGQLVFAHPAPSGEIAHHDVRYIPGRGWRNGFDCSYQTLLALIATYLSCTEAECTPLSRGNLH